MKKIISVFLTFSILGSQAFAYEKSAEIELLRSQGSIESFLVEIESLESKITDADQELHEELRLETKQTKKHSRLVSKLTKAAKRMSLQLDKKIDSMSEDELRAKARIDNIDSLESADLLRIKLKSEFSKQALNSVDGVAKGILEAGSLKKFYKKQIHSLRNQLVSNKKLSNGRVPASDELCTIFPWAGLALGLVLSLSFGLVTLGMIVVLTFWFPGGIIISYMAGCDPR